MEKGIWQSFASFSSSRSRPVSGSSSGGPSGDAAMHRVRDWPWPPMNIAVGDWSAPSKVSPSVDLDHTLSLDLLLFPILPPSPHWRRRPGHSRPMSRSEMTVPGAISQPGRRDSPLLTSLAFLLALMLMLHTCLVVPRPACEQSVAETRAIYGQAISQAVAVSACARAGYLSCSVATIMSMSAASNLRLYGGSCIRCLLSCCRSIGQSSNQVSGGIHKAYSSLLTSRKSSSYLNRWKTVRGCAPGGGRQIGRAHV